MNIAFDAVALLGPMSKNRGIGNYAMSQFKTLMRQDRENRYFFFNVFEDTDVFAEEAAEGLVQEDDFLCVRRDGSILSTPGFREFYGELVKTYIQKNQIDIFYITSPFDGHLPVYQREWFGTAKVIATVYDIIPYIYKDRYLNSQPSFNWYMSCIGMLRWTDRLLVISQSVKDDLISYLDFPPEKIDVIWGAPGPLFREIAVDPEEKNLLFSKFNIESPYVMCTGGDDERKNIAGLITAYSNLPEDLHRQYQLVVVCKLQRVSVERYLALAEESGVGGRVILTNFVSDEELLQLYNLATLVAFPSIYEGFGLPVVEAWACGTPVLTSCDSSLGQIAGDAAVLVDPNSVDSIAEGLRQALTERDLPELTKRGKERLSLFTWEEVAARTAASIDLTGGNAALSQPFDTSRPKLAFFTPLPPLQSGISDYSVDILRILGAYFSIDVFIDDGYQPQVELTKGINVYNHRTYPLHYRQYSATVYQIGNSTFHTYMWPYLKRFGGIMVLHDYNLHGIVNAYSLHIINSVDMYREILSADLDEETVRQCILSVESGNEEFPKGFELNGFLANFADKIIVHSREAQRKLLQRDIHRQVYHIHHYAKIEPLPEQRAVRKRLGIPEDALIFAAFGHVHETKRVIPILRAFSRIAARRDDARLLFVGKLDVNLEDDFSRCLETMQLQDRVTVTGYTELEDFTAYIDATDVCLNLRWPYNGETSGSLMRILAKGKCVVVNDTGSFGELPDVACIKLPSVKDMSPEEEVDAIAAAMERLADDEDYRRTLQKNARRFAEENLDIRKVAEQYRDVILGTEAQSVTEELIAALRPEVAGFDTDQLRRLADTLAYTCPAQ